MCNTGPDHLNEAEGGGVGDVIDQEVGVSGPQAVAGVQPPLVLAGGGEALYHRQVHDTTLTMINITLSRLILILNV